MMLISSAVRSQAHRTNILKPGPLAEPAPGLLEIGQMGSGQRANDDVRVARMPLDASKRLDRCRSEMDHLGSRLRVRKPEALLLKVDVLPAQRKDLGHAAAGEQQQTDRGRCRPQVRLIVLRVAEDRSEAGDLVLGQEAFALRLPELLNVPAGIGAVRPKAPQLGQIEHLRQQRPGPGWPRRASIAGCDAAC